MEKIMKVIKRLILCLSILFCAVSISNAAVECTIDLTSCPDWEYGDPSTWTANSDNHSLKIICTDNGSAVAGYSAQFQVTVNRGNETSGYTPFTDITLESTPTDSNGEAYLSLPLIHVPYGDGTYAHICPFDDIVFNPDGGSFSPLASFLNNSSGIDTYILSCLGKLGCCEITVTIICNPVKTFTFCTTSSALICNLFNYEDSYIKIASVFKSNQICNYCTFQCEGETAISLSSFTAKGAFRKVILQWKTETEIDNAGFNIYRAESENGQYDKINSDQIPPKGKSIQGSGYVYIDRDVVNGMEYFYKLEDIDLAGNSTYHGPISVTPKIMPALFGK
jgi:hypothetical protein